MTRWSWSLGVCALTLAICQQARGDGVILNGVSPRTIGRGGTNIAHTDNGSILHDNPAAMAFVNCPSMFEVGATVLTTDFHYRDPENDATSEHTPYLLPEFSLIRRSCRSPWAVGVGVFAPAGFGARYDLSDAPGFPGTSEYVSFGALGKILPGVAYRVNDRFAIGGTLGVGVTVADLEGPYVLQGPSLPGTPTRLDLDADGFALVWSVGFLYRLSDATTLGLTYQSESRFQAEGDTRVEVPNFGVTDYDTRLDITWPRSVGLGVRHELCPHRIVSTDVIWFNWNNAFDDLGLHLGSPTNAAFPTVYEKFPLDWRDTVSVRVGYEQRLGWGRTARVGYVYHRVAVPSGTITPYMPVPLEHAISVGYGWFYRGWDVDLAYMFTFGPEVNVETSDLLGGDFDQSTHRARTHAAGISFLRRW